MRELACLHARVLSVHGSGEPAHVHVSKHARFADGSDHEGAHRHNHGADSLLQHNEMHQMFDEIEDEMNQMFRNALLIDPTEEEPKAKADSPASVVKAPAKKKTASASSTAVAADSSSSAAAASGLVLCSVHGFLRAPRQCLTDGEGGYKCKQSSEKECGVLSAK